MPVTEINRRSFIQGASLLGVCLAINPGFALASSAHRRYATAFSKSNGDHFVGLLDHQGALISHIAVPSRGHSSCVQTKGTHVAYFARRPGTWLRVLDVPNGAEVARIESEKGRHFFGHGCYSRDGNFLYSVENDYENFNGVLGVYDVQQGYSRVGEIPTYGIGPHELHLLNKRDVVVIANGGIKTHPDYGRQKLNLESMRPNISFVELKSGKLFAQHMAPYSQASLRHLAVSPLDDVVIGAQYQGNINDSIPLVFSCSLENNLKPFSAIPNNRLADLQQYIGSVAINREGTLAITTSPRGNKVSLWDMESNQWIKNLNVPDSAGVAMGSGSSILFSSGDGGVYRYDLKNDSLEKMTEQQNTHWDNHLVIS